MHPFAMETAAILVHSLNRFSLCTKMAAVAVAKLLLSRLYSPGMLAKKTKQKQELELEFALRD